MPWCHPLATEESLLTGNNIWEALLSSMDHSFALQLIHRKAGNKHAVRSSHHGGSEEGTHSMHGSSTRAWTIHREIGLEMKYEVWQAVNNHWNNYCKSRKQGIGGTSSRVSTRAMIT
jgi:hypothetical protein